VLHTLGMDFMERALDLADQVAGGVAPRPPVGAVIVASDGKSVVGEGATEPHPGHHAEAMALAQAGEAARGGTIYCTLEPHQHFATTPPCSRAIIDAGIKRVVCPTVDPNPEVAGRGFEELTTAGIEVVRDVDEMAQRRADELVEGFAKLLKTGSPFVTAKWAMSLDGKIATRDRDSRWITGEAARSHAHSLRYRSDAVMTGIGTVLADDPRLTARDPNTGERVGNRPCLRVVVDSHGRIPANAALLAEAGEVMQVVATESPDSDRCEVIRIADAGEDAVDLAALLRHLGELGCHNVLVEAGEKLNGALFDMKLVDKVVAYISTSKVIGGEAALSPIGGSGSRWMRDTVNLKNTHVEFWGDDIAVIGYVDHRAEREICSAG